MKITSLLLALTLASASVRAQSASDKDMLDRAATVVATGNCDSAMKVLQGLSALTKEGSQYNKLMGKIYECKHNTEYATIYYDRALKADPRNDSLLSSIARLKDTGSQSNATEQALRLEREKLNLQNNKTHKIKQRNIDDFYALISCSYATMTGGQKAMAVDGITFGFSMGWPIINDNWLLDVNSSLGAVYGRANRWWNDPALKNQGIDAGDGMGLQMGIDPSINYMLINSKNHTITAGCILGGQLIFTGAWMQSAHNEVNNSEQTYFTIGPRVAYYGWKRLYIAAAYEHFGFRTLRATIDEHNKLVPVNLDQFRIDLGFRFNFDD